MEYIPDYMRQMGMSQEPWGLALNELAQASETGHDVGALRHRLDQLAIGDNEALLEIYREALSLSDSGSDSFDESDRESIVRALEPTAERQVDDLAGRVRGAWFGRVIGNLMGKPFEIGPTRTSIREYLTALGRYPLTGYVPFPEGADRSQLGLAGFEGVTEGRIDGGARDDDVDYTVLGLHLLETYGTGYSTEDVAVEWLNRFPAYQVFTAERAAYQNLIREVDLDSVGEHHNPFREWIGALIRADVFGYVYAGRPRAAALATYEDARLSHRSNGIYGEMWAAALIASAFAADSPEASVRASLASVPAGSRLADEIERVLADHSAGLTWEQALDAVTARHADMSWVHTINNAGALTAALLWGGGDFRLTVGLAVCAGLDTDSIAATAGSWAGAYLGFDSLPSDLVEPLHDTYHSGVFGFGTVQISALADRTLTVIERLSD